MRSARWRTSACGRRLPAQFLFPEHFYTNCSCKVVFVLLVPCFLHISWPMHRLISEPWDKVSLLSPEKDNDVAAFASSAGLTLHITLMLPFSSWMVLWSSRRLNSASDLAFRRWRFPPHSDLACSDIAYSQIAMWLYSLQPYGQKAKFP